MSPVADCRQFEPLFTPYVDGEAAAADAAAVAAHLDHCPPCRLRVDEEREARDALLAHRAALRAASQASPRLKARCAACAVPVVPLPSLPRRVLRRTLVPLSLAATLFLAVAAVFLIGFVGLNGSLQALANQFALDHVKCFQLAPKHGTVDPLAAGQEWSKQYGWGLVVPPGTSDEDLELLDVRRCLSSEGMTAHLMYKWHGQPLSVYVLDHDPSAAPDPAHVATRFGSDAVIWTRGGRTYAVVAGSRRGADLDRVAGYVRTIAR
jgi:anti-sigma factor RsiW